MNSLVSDTQFCTEMLPRVSRTFAPTIRMLPEKLYVPVTVAYLLCRIADTVEDEASLGMEEKKELLTVFSDIFEKDDQPARSIFKNGTAGVEEHNADVFLMHNLDRVLHVFDSFTPDVRKKIGKWVVEMSIGMRKFAQSKDRRKFQFLRNMKELDEYTYYVAGTVGHLLTALFEHFSEKITPNVVKRMELFSESFGKGLQMVNIIRDMAGDLRRGQSYIPEDILYKYELTRQSIFEAQNRGKAEKLFEELIAITIEHLDQAIAYVVTIPKEEHRIRLFCLLPLFWAMRTLQTIQLNTLALLETDKVKISRRVIKVEFYKSMVFAFSNRLALRHYRKIRRNFNHAAAFTY
jgi:farnesyl-diphosphate farnesyltransferase